MSREETFSQDLSSDEALETELLALCLRLGADLRREQLRRRIFFLRRGEDEGRDEVDPMEVVPDPGASPRDHLLAKEAGRRLSRALERLSPRQRAVFVLRHQEELTLKEIARMLELEEGTVKAHLHRAVTMLRKELKDLNEVS